MWGCLMFILLGTAGSTLAAPTRIVRPATSASQSAAGTRETTPTTISAASISIGCTPAGRHCRPTV